MSVGPIPWTALMAYCDDQGMEDPDDRDDFVHLVWSIDSAYLKHIASKDK